MMTMMEKSESVREYCFKQTNWIHIDKEKKNRVTLSSLIYASDEGTRVAHDQDECSNHNRKLFTETANYAKNRPRHWLK